MLLSPFGERDSYYSGVSSHSSSSLVRAVPPAPPPLPPLPPSFSEEELEGEATASFKSSNNLDDYISPAPTSSLESLLSALRAEEQALAPSSSGLAQILADYPFSPAMQSLFTDLMSTPPELEQARAEVLLSYLARASICLVRSQEGVPLQGEDIRRTFLAYGPLEQVLVDMTCESY